MKLFRVIEPTLHDKVGDELEFESLPAYLVGKVQYIREVEKKQDQPKKQKDEKEDK